MNSKITKHDLIRTENIQQLSTITIHRTINIPQLLQKTNKLIKNNFYSFQFTNYTKNTKVIRLFLVF